ncbi:glycosyltransferase [Flavobacterium sp. LB3P45]|uniref:Glycosyltransferase n=1 Tax=Flavobacterium fructosi TaxID=3230416 RepID=A0ABW6HI13_9FLAO
MRNRIKTGSSKRQSAVSQKKGYSSDVNAIYNPETKEKLPEILFITSYPPRECGIATYSQDLIKALNNKFKLSFRIKICPVESHDEQHIYSEATQYILNTDDSNSFHNLATQINDNAATQIVLIQHEFGLFRNSEADFRNFLNTILKPVILVFHTVLPHPNELLKENVKNITRSAHSIVVMTSSSAKILINDYGVSPEKIIIIAHGTHLVPHSDKALLKEKYQLTGRNVLSTFGFLSSGKSIETTLDALPTIIKENQDVLFLIIGKTHPSVVKEEGEKYRLMLQSKIETLQLQNHVQFINCYLSLADLLEYLQLTDVYLFTSKDPNQAVSGTFSYAMSCGCPIVSTPIPHVCEVLCGESQIIVDFGNVQQLAVEVNLLLLDEKLRKNISANALHKMAPTVWENAAVAHALLFEKIAKDTLSLHYEMPEINLDHIRKLTTAFGMIQFSNINQPDINSGYTLDDNARAMVAMCLHFELSKDIADLEYIYIYFDFIKYCMQPGGYFLNYVDENQEFTKQNDTTNLSDSNGRAVWALGYLVSISDLLPHDFAKAVQTTMDTALLNVNKMHSTRAMAFIIKGVYYSNTKNKSTQNVALIKELANRLVQMYRHESDKEWAWYESYLTYGNSILPEALLCAWLVTGDIIYKEIAKSSFDFLLSKIFREDCIKVVSNKGWLQKENEFVLPPIGGEQPIDVAYTILALSKFYEAFKEEVYLEKMKIAFSWFLGNNHLHQIIYNPCTGGCYDGLEDTYINLNQGAESTVSYLMARLTVKKTLKKIMKHSKSTESQMELFLKLSSRNQFA